MTAYVPPLENDQADRSSSGRPSRDCKFKSSKYGSSPNNLGTCPLQQLSSTYPLETNINLKKKLNFCLFYKANPSPPLHLLHLATSPPSTSRPPSPSMTLTKFLLVLTSLLLWFSPSSKSTCRDYCGHLPIKYHFGSGPGCGSFAFRHHIICAENSNSLHLITKTSSYPIFAIDYQDQLIFITDPSMSTCSTANPCKGFTFDSDAPFTFFEAETFILLNCSTSPSSPLHRIYSDANEMNCRGSNDSAICREFYSCPPIASLDIPVSTCCDYSPVDIGPGFELHLKKLQCISYVGLYSFNNHPDDP